MVEMELFVVQKLILLSTLGQEFRFIDQYRNCSTGSICTCGKQERRSG